MCVRANFRVRFARFSLDSAPTDTALGIDGHGGLRPSVFGLPLALDFRVPAVARVASLGNAGKDCKEGCDE